MKFSTHFDIKAQYECKKHLYSTKLFIFLSTFLVGGQYQLSLDLILLLNKSRL